MVKKVTPKEGSSSRWQPTSKDLSVPMVMVCTRLMTLLALSALILGVPVQVCASVDETSPDGPEWVKEYLTLSQALNLAFADADTVWSENWAPTDEERSQLEGNLGWLLAEPEFTFYRAQSGEEDLGYGLVMDEKGKFKPITFFVRIDKDFQVQEVLVMVFRESKGDGVRRKRFTKQFREKQTTDPLRLNRDIIGLSGATFSCRAIITGVRKALTVSSFHFSPQVTN